MVIRPGERVGLVGESGSGKSLTSLAVMDLLPPGTRRADGNIRFESVSVPSAESTRLRGREIGLVLQEPASALTPVYTVGSQLRETLVCLLGLSRREAEERGWAFDEIEGSMVLLRKAIYGEWDEDFLIVEPGQRIAATHDDGIISAGQP